MVRHSRESAIFQLGSASSLSRCRPEIEPSSGASPSAATVTCEHSSCKQPGSFCWGANWPKHGFGLWLVRAAQRLHPNVLAAALANKLARIAWTVLAQERSYARNEGRSLKGDGRRPTSEADPDSNSWLCRRGLRAGMKRDGETVSPSHP